MLWSQILFLHNLKCPWEGLDQLFLSEVHFVNNMCATISHTFCLCLCLLSLSEGLKTIWLWCALSRCAPSYHLLLHWIKPRRRILKLVKSIIEKINSVNPSGNSCSKITIEKAQFWYILSQEHNENRSYSGKHPTMLIKKIPKH